jgi:hypothetical protein
MPTIKIVPFPGVPGPQGPRGLQGIQGETGLTGPMGPAGQDAVASPETSYVVTGGALAIQPTFNGAPLFEGSYITMGEVVHFRVNVGMTNITSFGSGQYYIDLPFASKYDYVMRDGHIHDQSSGDNYGISGHVAAGESRLYLFYTNSNGADVLFDYNSPITLTTADHFHIGGTYIKG